MDKELVEYLLSFVTENKRQLFEKVLENRTRYLTVVVEDIYQPHNASAVVRSCDCFGIQEMHVIENKNSYKINPDVVLGASKWVDIVKHKNAINNTQHSLQALKDQGYKIIATTPHKDDIDLEDFNITDKTAILFGNEPDGLSEEALSMADGYLKVPMYGFTESLNISVCAAICLHHLTLQLRSSDLPWRLTEEEKTALKFQWAKSIIRKSELLEKDFLLKRGK